MPPWKYFTVYNLHSTSILSHILLNVVNVSDDRDRPRDAYFGTEFLQLERHDVYLPSAGTKSLMLKLKRKILHFFDKRTVKIA